MSAKESKKTAAKKPAKQKSRAKAVFDPDRPFAEGVRGAESFLVQDGIEYPRRDLARRPVIDG